MEKTATLSRGFLSALLCDNEIESLLPDMPKYRVRQIYKWILKGAGSFDQMTDIPAPLKEELKKHFKVLSSAPVSCHEDGSSKKIVIECADGVKIESVLLKDGGYRFTACVSTQAGCSCGCVFCKTGTLGFKRDLEAAEIAEQYLHLMNLQKNSDREQPAEDKNKTSHIIDSIVIMGMGEPFLNFKSLTEAVEIFTDPEGLNISKRRITVSTCGICRGLFDIARNGPYIKLALSLATADEKLRTSLMPVTRHNPLSEVKKALLLFQKKSGSRITLEIPLLGGINTNAKDAASIRGFAEGLSVIVNIIPWNPVAGLEYNGIPLREPDKKELTEYIAMLENFKMKVTTRLHKGRNVMGACGQLGN